MNFNSVYESNLEKIKNSHVLIIGDIMLDRYIFGSVNRISPEAPVPVMKAEKETETLGGAANVANNVAGLGAGCALIGVAGEDGYKKTVTRILDKLGVYHYLLNSGVITTTKIRVVGERQQIVRIDYEELPDRTCRVNEQAEAKVAELLPAHNVAILSDYGKGFMDEALCQYIIKAAHKSGKISIVDPKGADWEKYRGATIVTPNVKELGEVAGRKVRNEDEDITTTAGVIRKKYNLTYLIVTRSEKGISIIAEDRVIHMPTQAQEVFDVSGAGDTVVATMASVLAYGADIETAVSIANRAAGIVVSKIGTVPILYSELRQSYQEKELKAVPLDNLLPVLADMKFNGKKIVFTNGCFDILHKGHVDYLCKARELGDVLVVGLNSDASVKRLKGDSRPVNNEEDRAFILSALKAVDFVVIFEEDTPAEILSRIRPDILVKGGDYKPDQVIGRKYAGEIVIIDFVEGYSTTDTIDKLSNR